MTHILPTQKDAASNLGRFTLTDNGRVYTARHGGGRITSASAPPTAAHPCC